MFDVLFAGLIHGSAYALVAVGMSLIFGVTNVANFAQGSIVAVGMMIAWWLGSSWGWGIVPTFVAVLVVTALLGLIMNVAIIAPLEGRKPIAALLATIGVGQVLDNGLQIVFGPQTRPFPKLLQTYNLQVAGVSGIFVGLFNGNINPMNGGTIGMTAFVAATIGGLGSIPGAVVGGLVLGVVEAFGISLFGDGAHDLITFGALIIILIVKPQGLLGPKTDVKSEPLTGTFLGGGRAITLPWWGNLIGAVALVSTPFFFNDYLSGVGTQVAIYAIAAVGLTLISGSAGQTILGMAGPFAVGAYASAILATQAHWPFLVTLPAAGVIAALVASVLTFPVWRFSGHYVAIATIGVGAVMVAIIRLAEPLTKGSLGIQGIPFPKVFGVTLYTQQMMYLLDVIVLLVTLVIVMRIRTAHLGRVFEAVGSDREASEALSIRTGAYKALAYALAAFFAGLAGSLLAHQYTYIDPTIFNSNMSILILTIIVLGGMNSPLGAVLGSIVLIGAPELLRFASDARILLYGVLLVLVILFRPQGLFARKG